MSGASVRSDNRQRQVTMYLAHTTTLPGCRSGARRARGAGCVPRVQGWGTARCRGGAGGAGCAIGGGAVARRRWGSRAGYGATGGGSTCDGAVWARIRGWFRTPLASLASLGSPRRPRWCAWLGGADASTVGAAGQWSDVECTNCRDGDRDRAHGAAPSNILTIWRWNGLGAHTGACPGAQSMALVALVALTALRCFVVQPHAHDRQAG